MLLSRAAAATATALRSARALAQPAEPTLVTLQRRGMAFNKNALLKQRAMDAQRQEGKKKSGEGRDPYLRFKEALLAQPDPELRDELPYESYDDRMERKRRFSQRVMCEVCAGRGVT